MRGSKYHAKRTVVDGIVFDSAKEAARWRELRLLERSGAIEGLQRQVTFTLVPAQPGERAVKYIADFAYTEGGRDVVEDVKGLRTPAYIIKRKLFKMQHKDTIFRET